MVTLNGFPYAASSAEVVKTRVYHPDWADRASGSRYTLDLARVLADLLPDDAAEGIDLHPAARPGAPRGTSDRGRDAPAPRWTTLADGLAALHGRTGKLDPGRLRAGAGLRRRDHRPGRRACWPASDRDWLGVCLDTCHLACAFEDPADRAGRRCPRPGCRVVKVQVSAALHAEHARLAERAALRRFDEPRFLHQTRSATGGCAAPTTSARRWPARAARRRARGGCTSTCRCTHAPRRHRSPPRPP